jgi:hypothetical protein
VTSITVTRIEQVFANLMVVSLMKLRLDPQAALTLVAAMMIRDLINIPVRKAARTDVIIEHDVCGSLGLFASGRGSYRAGTHQPAGRPECCPPSGHPNRSAKGLLNAREWGCASFS